MTVIAETRTVYRSTARGRSFLTKQAACKAEAVAIIKAKYPTEPHESDSIGATYPGFHWSEMPRANVLLRRLMRRVRLVTDAEGE